MDTVKELNHLIQAEIDTAEVHDQALKYITEDDIHSQLVAMRQDHERHIANLSHAIRLLNGEPIKRSKDFKGFLLKGYAAVKSMLSTRQALAAIQYTEELTNKSYSEALNKEFPSNIREIIRSNYEDGIKHQKFLSMRHESVS